MAEVKRAASGSSFSLSTSKKKPPSFSNNGVSSTSTSFKHIYDDVFGSSSPSKEKSSPSFMEDDYAEIFGSSKSNNGAWSIPYSSIPILDLPKEKGFGVGNGGGGERVDYGGVFGGVFDSSDSFGLPDGEELFDQLKKKPKTSSAAHILPRSQGQTTEAISPEISGQSYDWQSPTNGFCPTFDNKKHFEPGNKVIMNTIREPRKAAHVRAYSLHEVCATQKILSSQTPVIKDDTLDRESKHEQKHGKHARHTSLDLGANIQNSNSDAGLQKVSSMRGPYSADTSHDTCQSSNTATNGFCPSVDSLKHSEYKINELSIERTSREPHTTDARPIQEFSHSLQPEAQPESTWSNELGPTQKTLSSTTSVLSDETQSAIGADPTLEQSKHSCNTSLDLAPNRQSGQCDPVFQKACGLSESPSFNTSHETCQASFTAGPSKAMKDDAGIAVGCDEVKKKDRRSRMTSIDLGDYKPSCEHNDGPKRKPRFGGSYSFDASHDPCAAHVKAQPSKMYPSSSLPQFFPVENHYKVSDNSSCKNSQKNLYRGSGGSLPSLVEELDVNSAAAVSAAALQRAIEEAEMRIRLAKAFLERECQGSINLRFKDTLKVKVSEKNVLANERNNNMHECSPPIVSDMQPYSPLERKSVVKTVQAIPVFEDQALPVFEDQVHPVFEDQKNSVTDWELTEEKGAKALNLIGEDDKHEGEWEAAKHLNQLISGVKSRLASFMSWQTETDTDTEKKEDPKEMEAIMKPQQQPEEAEHDFKDHEAFKRNTTEGNHGTTTSAGKAMHGQYKIQYASEVLEPEESIRSFNVKHDKAGNTVDFIPDPAGPSSENFQFFAFRNQITCDTPDPEVEEKGPQESSESEIENGQEKEMKEVKNEHIPLQDEEQREPDDECVTHDIKRQDDMYKMSGFDPSDEENDKTVEVKNEHTPLQDEEQREPDDICVTHDIKRQDDMNKMSGFDPSDEENDKTVEVKNEHIPLQDEERQEHDDKCVTHDIKRQDDMHKMSGFDPSDEGNDKTVEEPCSLAEHNEMEISYEEDSQGVMNRNINTCSINEENVEIVEEHYSMAGHDIKESAHEEGWQVDMSSRSYIGSFNEENQSDHLHESEIVEEHYSMAGHDIKESAHEEGWQVDTSSKSYIGSFNEENQSDHLHESEIVEEDYSMAGHDIKESAHEKECQVDMSSKSYIGSFNEENQSDHLHESEIVEEHYSMARHVIKESTHEEGCQVVMSTKSYIGSFNEEKQPDHLHESEENLLVGEFDTGSDQDAERSGVEASHRRRRWFDNSGITGTAERPSILEGNQTDLGIDQEVFDESELSGSVEIHVDKLDCSAAEVITARGADTSSNHDKGKTNVELTPTRRKWFDKRGEEGVPEPLTLFEGIKVNLEVPLECVNESGNCLDKLKTKCGESLNAVKPDVTINGDKGKQNGEAAPRRKRWFEGGERVGLGEQVRITEDVGLTGEIDQESNVKGGVEKHVKLDSMSVSQKKDDVHNKVEPVKEHPTDLDDLNRKEKAREKEKIAVERAIREARERAFAEARERARKDAAERPNVEAQQKVAAGVQEKLGKSSSEATSSLDKASVEAKLKAERAAVERATSEARERALQKALSEKASHRSREQEPKYQSSRGSDSSNNSEKFEGVDAESAQRRKARLERQKRTMERATNALEEKNRRDILAQKEQTAKNMLADSLAAEVKRWSTGKEGNLRALLSTLQYILGPDSGWQPVSLTDLVAATAVRKSYKKATLCVHPDKLQQRGATIQQKYICEKVFDLLKEAWSKFNPDER